MSISVVIPFYNHWELTHQLLFDLYKAEGANIDEIVLVNNGSTDEEISGGIRYWREMFENIDVSVNAIKLRENVGFLLAANLGLQHSLNRIRILISNDVRIKGKFINNILEIINNGKHVLIGQKLLSHDTGWNMFDGKIFPYLEGFFLAATSDDWDELEYFDVDFVPQDYEDVALSTYARELHFELVPLNLPYIQHNGAGTLGYTDERRKNTEKNREVFRKNYVKG